MLLGVRIRADIPTEIDVIWIYRGVYIFLVLVYCVMWDVEEAVFFF